MTKKIYSAGTIDYNSLAGRSFGMRRFNLDFLAITFGGEAFFLLEDEGISAKVLPVSFVYVPAGKRHLYDPDIKTKWQNCWVLFDGNAAKQAFGELIPNPGISSINNVDKLSGFWGKLSLSMLDDNELDHERAFCMLHNILLELREQSVFSTEKQASPAITEVIRFMRDNIRRPELNFRKTASRNGICTDSLRKRFKHETGISMHQYFIRLKINAAKSMLSNMTYSISGIADFLGFNDQYYFSRLFKKKIGISPLKYRNKLISGR